VAEGMSIQEILIDKEELSRWNSTTQRRERLSKGSISERYHNKISLKEQTRNNLVSAGSNIFSARISKNGMRL
jgi:hypothetical protein